MVRVRVFSVLMMSALLSLLIAPSASAAVVGTTIGGITYSADSANVAAGATVTAYDGTTQGTAVTIPASVAISGTSYAVTTVGTYAFSDYGLTSVTIPASVTTIGTAAFYNNRLTSVIIPNSVTTIGPSAFLDNLLTSVIIPNSVTTIGRWAFSSSQLTSATISTSVTTIGNGAFYSNRLTSVTIPASVTTIGTDAFNHNPNLADVMFVGAAPATIGTDPFGATGSPGGPLVSYYARYAGFTSPTWTSGGVGYRSQALATVTFDAQGHGTTPTPVDVAVGGTVADPGALTATGYTFTGWFTAASGGTAFDFSAGTSTDITVYAHWTPIPYNVTVDPGNGGTPATTSHNYGTSFAAPTTPTWAGHTFNGWFDAATGGTAVTFPLTIMGNTSVYAQWTARAVTTPADATDGGTITITGTGFQPGETVQIELHSTPVLLTTVTATATGTISATVTVPASTPPGAHSLVFIGSATGTTSDAITINAALAFTGANPWPASLTALGLIGIGLVLRRRKSA